MSGVGDNNFTLTGSTISGQLSQYGLEINNAANALITNDTIVTNPSGGFDYGVFINSATNATISNDILTGNGYASTLLYADLATNLLVNAVTASGSTNIGMLIYGSTGLIENSTVNSSQSTTGLNIPGTSSTGLFIAEGNTVYGEIAGNAYGAAIYVESYAEAINNIVYNSNIGITAVGSGARQSSVRECDRHPRQHRRNRAGQHRL